MAYPNNPREVRQVLHTVYDRYKQGVDIFPAGRPALPVGEYPRKTQPIAKTLLNACLRIDLDRQYFDTWLEGSVNGVQKTGGKGVIVTRIGINAVQFASISPDTEAAGRVQVVQGLFAGEERDALFEHLDLKMTDGRILSYREGKLAEEPTPEGVILRGYPQVVARPHAAASLFIAQPETQAA